MEISDIFLIVVTVFLCVISFVLMAIDIRKHPLKKIVKPESSNDISDLAETEKTDASTVSKVSKQKSTEISDNESVFTPKLLIYSIIMILITIGISLMMIFVYEDNELIFSMKRLCLLSLMWPIALIDLKTYRIPNLFIIFGLILRAVLLVFELLKNTSDLKYVFLSEGIAVGALLVVSILCAIVVKNSIGLGDIKLFIVMGLLLGMEGIWSSMFASLIISFIVSVYYLVTKKKTRKDLMPFGPALVFGTYLSVFLTGM